MLQQVEANLATVDFAGMNWQYEDPVARAELTRRIRQTGAKQKLIVYSDLVRGVAFHVPNIKHAATYLIDTSEWEGLDRALLGSFLGQISAESYMQAGFLASALVVNKSGFRPSDQFFEWMEELGVLPNLTEDTVLAFWADQVNKAHNWYSKHPHGAT
jgi:hypothetical protein